MAIVNLEQMQDHAKAKGYGIGLVPVSSLSMARGVLNQALQMDVPLVLLMDASQGFDELMPSIELLARKTKTAVAIVAHNIQNPEQAIVAIRLGCNALIETGQLSPSLNKEIAEIAESCGVPLLDTDSLAKYYCPMDISIEKACLNAISSSNSWYDLEQRIQQTAMESVAPFLRDTQACGQGQELLKQAELWQPVEHLIIYNTICDEEQSQELARKGREILDEIPGVRQTWSGMSVNTDASYRYCWLIRFANTKVIDSYREHPDHVAYANQHFRPFAGDRISIDYQLIGTEEEKA